MTSRSYSLTIFDQTARKQAGGSEPLLVVHTTLLEISCHDSYTYALQDSSMCAYIGLAEFYLVDIANKVN